MRRVSAIVALALAATLAVPAGAQARQGETEWQFVSGTIRFITRFIDGDGGWPGLVRRVYNASAASNGLIGYVFRVDPATIMGRFELEVTSEGGEGLPDPFSPADLGVYFYSEFGDAGGQAGPETTGRYERRAPGGETGFVPPETRYAVVFMSRGLNVDFTYRGFTPMSVEVSEAGFAPGEVTVGEGGWVVWQNVGADFHGVTADDGSFSSSPTEKHPIIPGATFATQFFQTGDVTYHDPYSTATGVVHVVEGPGPPG